MLAERSRREPTMTEADWLTGADPAAMLRFVWDRASGRKRRLLACGCCRLHWDRVGHPASRLAVEVAELYADRQADPDSLRGAFEAGFWWPTDTPEDWSNHRLEWGFACAAAPILPLPAISYVLLRKTPPEALAQCGLLRDLFGPLPFRAVAVVPSWLTSTVVGLAGQMYDSRDLGAMPVLADAPHARGCWVVDLVLGKT
jgi:hypothetical protein